MAPADFPLLIRRRQVHWRFGANREVFKDISLCRYRFVFIAEATVRDGADHSVAARDDRAEANMPSTTAVLQVIYLPTTSLKPHPKQGRQRACSFNAFGGQLAPASTREGSRTETAR